MNTTFKTYADLEADILWRGLHKRTSLSKVNKFSAFEDNSTRLITDYRPSNIHRFFTLPNIDKLGWSLFYNKFSNTYDV